VCTFWQQSTLHSLSTGWRRLIGCLKLQVIFRKRATNYRALLRKMTYEDKASYDSTPPCIHIVYHIHTGEITCCVVLHTVLENHVRIALDCTFWRQSTFHLLSTRIAYQIHTVECTLCVSNLLGELYPDCLCVYFLATISITFLEYTHCVSNTYC